MGEDIFLRAARQQKFHHAEFGVIRQEGGQVNRVVQRREPPFLILLIDVCAMCQQQVDDVLAPVHDREVQRRRLRLPQRTLDKAGGSG